MQSDESTAFHHELTDADLEPEGPGVRLPRRRKRLGGAIPVRFAPETIERIKTLAEAEGMTVSAWIRKQIDRSLADREPPEASSPHIVSIDTADAARARRAVSRLSEAIHG